MRSTPAPSNHANELPAEDRRRHPRFALSLAITVRGDNNFYTGLTGDVSEGGAFIATQHILPIGTPVVLTIALPMLATTISVEGTVRWVRDPNALARREDVFGHGISEVKSGMGVQFHHVEAEALRAIVTFMGRRTPEFFD